MRMHWTVAGLAALVLGGCASTEDRDSDSELVACKRMVSGGFQPIADEPQDRFLGKVDEDTARCRGGEKAVAETTDNPWVDWASYYATGDASSKSDGREAVTLLGKHVKDNGRGIDGALLDLEYQRVELIKFNLRDNYTYADYVTGRSGVSGRSLKVWDEMRLPAGHPEFQAVGGNGAQLCRGELIRHRNLTGICNDIRNPLMGSTGTDFARNVAFEATYPRLGKDELARNRHDGRIDLMTPDPQVISRELFTRDQSQPQLCNAGLGDGGSPEAHCDYLKAPFFNVLAAFWIQFMTHDWFTHLDEGRNARSKIRTGCDHELVDGEQRPIDAARAAELGCRPAELVEASLESRTDTPSMVRRNGHSVLARAPRTTTNRVTAWWDASQIYGYDARSLRRVKRDPRDPAKLLMTRRTDHGGSGEVLGYLPLLEPSDPSTPQWAGQEATGFPDNWTVGLSFYHNLFSREHNTFVRVFRQRAREMPDADSGLRDPNDPERVITYSQVTDEELFQIARLVVAAQIAKIHTIEWTTQLLYGEPLYRGLNANWNGLFEQYETLSKILAEVVRRKGQSTDEDKTGQWYSILAAGPGIVGVGSRIPGPGGDQWDLTNPDHVNGGVNHFGSPFNFPEEFVTVYRLHPLLPDLIEMRDLESDPNAVAGTMPVVATFRGAATAATTEHGMANLGVSMGRQRLGLLTLGNHPQFTQNIPMPHLGTPTGTVDIAALDILRDREHGIPRFNEFRRQIGLKQLTSFDDFVDTRLPEGSAERRRQEAAVVKLRDVYGQHRCDASKIITDAQVNQDGTPINDCLGHADGSMVDNIEDVDMVVGMLAEFRRPHGFAISETQFQIFILNASRRLFSDRFFTSSFRPEFYTHLGIDWVNDNGPNGPVYEKGEPNGHKQLVSPLKSVMLRNVPELAGELDGVVNVFDPWARDRGEYYSLAWQPRPGAESDPAFAE